MKTGYVIAGTALVVGLTWYFFGRKQKPSAIAVPDPQPDTVRTAIPGSPVVTPAPAAALPAAAPAPSVFAKLRDEIAVQQSLPSSSLFQQVISRSTAPVLVAAPQPNATTLNPNLAKSVTLTASNQVKRDGELWFSRDLAGIDLVL